MHSKHTYSGVLKVCSYVVVCLMVLCASANASLATDRSAFIEAFKRSYHNPGDVDAALKYAEEAVKIGDYEAAIPPLERILMFNPELSEVRLEVGVLYYLLNSREMARKHLATVLKDNKASAALKQRAESYLAKL